MKCKCGAMADPGEGTVLCSQCGRQNLTCPNCGAHLTAQADTVVVSCFYCDASLQHQDLSQGAPYFTVNFDDAETRVRVLTFLLNRFGIPGDFERRFQVTEQKLVYVPVHLYTVTARLSATVSETDSKAVIATRNLWYRDKLESYRFAMRAKVFVDPRKIRGTVYDIDVSRQQADAEAHAYGATLMARDRKRFDEIPTEESIQLEHEGMVNYPLFQISYQYGSTNYQTIFDPSAGVVCHTDHPMSLKTRVALKMVGLVFLAFTLVGAVAFALTIGTGFARVMDPLGIGGVGAAVLILLTGLAVTGRIFKVALTRQGSGEEIEASEQPLDLSALTATIPVAERKTVGEIVS